MKHRLAHMGDECIPNVPTYISNDHEHQNGTINSSLVGVIIGDWKFYNHQGLCFNSKRSIRVGLMDITCGLMISQDRNLIRLFVTCIKHSKDYTKMYSSCSEYTEMVLDILKKENVKATFFVNGKNCIDVKNDPLTQKLIKREAAEGHIIASHTYSHPLNVGVKPAFFRPPLGEYIEAKIFSSLKTLYLTSKVCVKIDKEYSESFTVMKSVRQRRPLSPILFNLFINDIFEGYLKKLLKHVNNWAINNNMVFGINKCATMVKTYNYLGIPFDNTLSLDPIINAMNNTVRKALIQGSSNKNPMVSLYAISKELNIPPLSTKCANTHIRLFQEMEKIPIVLFPTLVNNIPRHRCYFWSKESSSLLNRCTDCPTTKEIRKKQIYKNKKNITNFVCYILNIQKGFHWLLRARYGYKVDSKVLKATKLVKSTFPDACPCCNSTGSKQIIETLAFRMFKI
ncbi:hypothetical protein U3516DRAFT_769880 [Neocallimastix sp. 'constans']